jgi:maltose O-acetyltransferase
MPTERERMLQGLPYLASDPELVAARLRARKLLRTFNLAAPEDDGTRRRTLGELLAHCGARVWIEPPFHCDYGSNLWLGDDVYFNFNCVVLDCAPVRIGHRVLVAPNVQILAATHSVDVAERRSGRELALPVTVGDDVWLGAGAIVAPGVSIGAGTTVGAGSVVVADLPAGVMAAGNPCRVVRKLRAEEA